MKTKLTGTTLADILIVGRALPKDEIEQIEAFSGVDFDVQNIAVDLFSAAGPKWTIRVEKTGEPLVVAGIIPCGPNVWRTWFLANQRAWDEFGKEVTVHTAKTRKQILENSEDHCRIETMCLATRKKAQEWYGACGLKHESTMHGYGVNGEAAVMYVSTKGAKGY